MTPRDRRLDMVQMHLERASIRHREGEIVQEPYTAAELEAIIEDRKRHPRPVMQWTEGDPLTPDHYTLEELIEILDFEKEHPLGGDRE